MAKKRGISKDQVCVLVAIDRNGDIVSQNAGQGRITAVEIDAVLGTQVAPGSFLCTDSDKNYVAFAMMKGLQHEVINVHKGVYVRKGIYHVQHVNAYHKRLKKWMERFQGVATKYLDNYLFWFRFLERYKDLTPYEAKRSILRYVKAGTWHYCGVPTSGLIRMSLLRKRAGILSKFPFNLGGYHFERGGDVCIVRANGK